MTLFDRRREWCDRVRAELERFDWLVSMAEANGGWLDAIHQRDLDEVRAAMPTLVASLPRSIPMISLPNPCVKSRWALSSIATVRIGRN